MYECTREYVRGRTQCERGISSGRVRKHRKTGSKTATRWWSLICVAPADREEKMPTAMRNCRLAHCPAAESDVRSASFNTWHESGWLATADHQKIDHSNRSVRYTDRFAGGSRSTAVWRWSVTRGGRLGDRDSADAKWRWTKSHRLKICCRRIKEEVARTCKIKLKRFQFKHFSLLISTQNVYISIVFITCVYITLALSVQKLTAGTVSYEMFLWSWPATVNADMSRQNAADQPARIC